MGRKKKKQYTSPKKLTAFLLPNKSIQVFVPSNQVKMCWFFATFPEVLAQDAHSKSGVPSLAWSA